MNLIRSWGVDSCLGGQEIPYHLYNRKVCFCVHNPGSGPHPEPDQFSP